MGIFDIFRRPPERRHRVVLSVAGGLLSGFVTLVSNVAKPWPRDFAQVWFAARSILAGVDPYPLVGPHLTFDWMWPLLYPLPAGVAAIPLAWLSASAAAVVFSTLCGAAFAWALMEHGYSPLYGFVGGGLHFAAETAQWSPLLAAAMVVPPLGFFLVAKPTVGAAIFAARPNWWPVAGALVLGGIAFALQPHWVAGWLDAIHRNALVWAPAVPYRAPIQLPGGFLALLCLARWRRPEARLVAVLACVPQTMMLYETVPLFLVPRSFKESVSLVALSYAVFYWLEATLPASRTHVAYLAASGPAIVIALYLPVTWMVLRRPNAGPVPAWLERRIAALPRSIRGEPAHSASVGSEARLCASAAEGAAFPAAR